MKTSSSLEELTELLRWRRDVRHFRREPVEASLIEKLIEIAQHSPSVGYSQPWRFVLVESLGRRAQVRANFEAANLAAAESYGGDRKASYLRLKLAGLDNAPVHLAVFCDSFTSTGHALGRMTMPETLSYSAVLAVHTFWLAAAAAGLGVGWVSIADPLAFAEILDVPKEWRLIAYLCVGYAEAASETPELAREGWQQRDDRAGKVLLR